MISLITNQPFICFYRKNLIYLYKGIINLIILIKLLYIIEIYKGEIKMTESEILLIVMDLLNAMQTENLEETKKLVDFLNKNFVPID